MCNIHTLSSIAIGCESRHTTYKHCFHTAKDDICPASDRIMSFFLFDIIRYKHIGNVCARQMNCQFCKAILLHFKQQGIVILARPMNSNASSPMVPVPASIIFACPFDCFCCRRKQLLDSTARFGFGCLGVSSAAIRESS